MKKKFLSLLLAAALSLAVTGCGKAPAADTQAASTAQGAFDGEKTVINVWAQGGLEEEPLSQIFKGIEEELGNVEIVFSNFPKQEQLDKLQVAPAVGDTPDIVFMDYLQVPYYYTLGMVACIDDRVDEELRADLLPSVIDECSYNGKLYALAHYESGLSFWANKSMLEKAGVRIPSGYRDAWDRAEFEEVLQKLQDSGVEHPLYMRQNNPSTLYFSYMPILRSFGGDFMDRETMLTAGTLNGENTIKAYEYISWLVEKGYVDPYVDYDDGFNVRQENALSLMGNYKYPEYYAELGDDLILVPTPDMGEGVFTCSGSGVFFMTTAATQRGVADLAWEVMKRTLAPDAVDLITDANAAIPALRSVLAHKKGYQKGEEFYLYREQLEDGISYLRPITPAHMTNYTAVGDATANIFLGADPTVELNNASANVDEVILENGWDHWIR